ncbi:hypothetical protein [Flavobacterium wongokense]|uniref:hypothetical protein n=1 Tax=Flavobacterium wongokense TaxID=2910674 RepID=UPI001F4286C0|nr:hypothetical protein [Flavobacterium sp. WG47]MCF6133241.1 hypothetical protein [Flavobacterium sp. WG47]
MENKNNGAYGREAHNSPTQLLSYFDSHINKYPDGPKSSEMEINNEKLSPYQEDDEEDENATDEDQESFDFDSEYDERYQF